MFNTKYNRIRSTPEKNNQERNVEVAGYIPAKKRIENIMYAGMNLLKTRAEQYDYPDGKDDDQFPNHRRRNYDMADASQEFYALQDVVESKRKAVAEASRKAQEELKIKNNTNRTLDDKKGPDEL